jgi:CheY-like chemotaxis protein
MSTTSNINKILLVDDDPDDCYLFTDAIKQCFPEMEISCVENFLEALSYLTTQTPDLIFMDLNMPFKNGFECLSELKANHAFRSIPVIIFSSSNYIRDIKQAYEKGAALYYTKPVSFEVLRNSLEQILNKNWQKPAIVTAEYFIEGEYQPFKNAVH